MLTKVEQHFMIGKFIPSLQLSVVSYFTTLLML